MKDEENGKFLIVLLLVLGLFVFGLYGNISNSKNKKVINSLFNIFSNESIEKWDGEIVSVSACTGEVTQAACYSDYPRPVLHWKCEKAGESVDDYYFALQVDDDEDFSSPELDFAELSSRNFFYEISEPGLNFATDYHWRIKVKNSAGEWSGWAKSDDVFTTSSLCD